MDLALLTNEFMIMCLIILFSNHDIYILLVILSDTNMGNWTLILIVFVENNLILFKFHLTQILFPIPILHSTKPIRLFLDGCLGCPF